MTANLGQRRAHARHGAADINRTVDAATAEVEAWKTARYEAAKAAAAEREATRHRYTADELRDARAVRDSAGWHRVVRVNRTSVTVATAYSWDDRIALDKILEARA